MPLPSPSSQSQALPEPQVFEDPAPSSSWQRNSERAMASLRHWRLLICTPHRPYANLLWLTFGGRCDNTAQRLVGICDSVSVAHELLPDQASDVLVVSDGRLRDGPALPWLTAIGQRPAPPTRLLILEQPLERQVVQAAWRDGVEALVVADNFGRGVLRGALEALEQGQRYLDPCCLALMGSPGPAHDSLSSREQEVLQLLAQGLTNRQIGIDLGIAEVTARDHVKHILQKLQVADRTAAAVMAMRLGYIH